jgi:glycosyltransferase involved in cell wall biosynthesis
VSEQLAGKRQPLCAPGGLSLDAITRRLVAASDQALAPWSRPSEFRAWLAARYWTAVHRERADLRTAFADPDGVDRNRFDAWCRTATLDDGAPLLLDIPARHQRALPVASTLRHDGLNLVGYLTRDFSLGDVARRLLDALSQADVPVSTIAHQRTQSPVMANPPRIDDEVRFATTLAVVTADQFPTLPLDLGPVVHATERMIGYWFWELEHVPRHMRDVAAMVDQVWAGSRFVTEALAAALPCPVHHVPIPVPQPETSGRARASFPPLADSLDRFVFAVVFDHLSVTERKNPVGVIEAFRRAFAPGEGPLLVVKTMNARQRWPQHQRVQLAAEGRDDIVVWDEHLARADQMAFLRAVDCLVSLHRSEGLGLHLAEAMWLGTPVIATRYSGNLDLMDDDCAVLIDADQVPVRGGEGVYPPEARWADPDLDQAAAAMRRVATDRAFADRLREAGRNRMLAQPSLADTGRHIAALLGIDPSAPTR